jgi:putative aldouronate transport system substrate-binding protein
MEIMRIRMAKLLTLAIALTVVMIFAACGAGGGTPPAGDTGAAAPAPALGAPEATADHDPRAYQPVPAGDWNVPFPEPVHITAASTLGINWHFEGDDTMENSPWTRLWRDELNVHVTFDWLAVDDFDTRLNMTIAADNLPDVFFVPVSIPRTFNQLQAAGTLLDLTHAYNNYASQRIRDFELVDPDTIQVFTFDGRLYGIPRYYYGQIDQPWHLWVRKDWYEAEGSPAIRTVADLENLARAFMANHGANYGISVDNELQFLFRTAPMFGAYVGDVHDNLYFWRPDDTGRLRPGIAFPEFMVALEYWQRWFAEGIISADFVTMGPWDRTHEDVVNGLVGIQPWWQWWGWMNGPNVVGLQHNDAYFIPLNFPTLDGSRPARGQISFPNQGVVVAHRDFQNPGALMKILSMTDHMIFSPDANLTPEQLHYFMADGREHGMGPVFKIIDPQADLLQYIHVNHALDTGDTSQLFTTGMQFKFNDSYAWINDQYPPGALGAFLQMGFREAAYGRAQHLFDNGWIVQNALWGHPPDEFDQAGTTGDIILEEVMQIIMGVQPVSHFENVLERWYAQGGQIKEDAVNLHFGN